MPEPKLAEIAAALDDLELAAVLARQLHPARSIAGTVVACRRLSHEGEGFRTLEMRVQHKAGSDAEAEGVMGMDSASVRVVWEAGGVAREGNQ